ncbi:MAG: RND family transporter [Dehalococcoidales bacterium]|nr:RND family transporter [Dehalococcoidales bacterium]
MKKFIVLLTNFVEKMPWWVIAIVIILSAAAVPGVLLLETDSSLNTLVSPDSPVYQDTQRYQEKFGDDPVTIILNGNVQDIFSSANLYQLSRFEQEFSASHECYIISPVTLLNQAVTQALAAQQTMQAQLEQALKDAAQAAIQQAAAAGLDEAAQQQAAQQAQAAVMQQFQSAIEQFEQIGTPSLDNPNFIAAVLYNSDGNINESFASIIPDDTHALIIVTPTGDTSNGKSLELSHDLQDYFSDNPLQNVTASFVGYALVTEDISNSMSSNLLILLGLAVVVMVIVLFFLFRVRWRLLSLLVVGIGTLWTFGVMGYVPIPITMATMAVLPILIGLGIDYPIQFHNRYQEELSRNHSVGRAVAVSFGSMAPAVGVALLATVIGFATLYISDVPMIKDFGIILVIGVVICYIVALFFLYSVVYLGDKKMPVAKLSRISVTGGTRIERGLAKMTGAAVKRPLLAVILAVALGVGGGIADRWLPVNADYQQLIPQNLPALKQVRNLNEILGIGGQITLMVEADDISGVATLTQLQEFQTREMSLHPELISVNSPVTLVTQSTGGVIPPQEQIDQVLAATPAPFLRQVLSGDGTTAAMSFYTSYITLDETQQLLESIEADSLELTGITVSPVGTVAMSVATIDSVIGSRMLMNGLCLAAIFIMLLLLYRRPVRALFIAVSVGLVIAWASLLLFIFNIPLNPLTAILGVITAAIGTEFMVLLDSRYEEEKALGEPPHQAMLTAAAKMGRAIVTTGVTTLGGFAVLIASNFVMVRDFGIATVIGIFLCLVSTMLVMPPLMVWWDERMALRRAKKAAK